MTVDAKPDAAQRVEPMNAWLADFAELLELIRERVGRELTDDDRRRVFAYTTEAEVPR